MSECYQWPDRPFAGLPAGFVAFSERAIERDSSSDWIRLPVCRWDGIRHRPGNEHTDCVERIGLYTLRITLHVLQSDCGALSDIDQNEHTENGCTGSEGCGHGYSQGRLDTVRTALSAGMDLDCRYPNRGPLHYMDKQACVRAIDEDISMVSQGGCPPLQHVDKQAVRLRWQFVESICYSWIGRPARCASWTSRLV